ncbi:MAG: phosphoribosylglycinamide formyltransferase [Ignavibacteriales bacterium]
MKEIKLIYKPDNNPMSVAVFVSGSGTNLRALHEEQRRLEESGDKNYGEISAVFTNAPNCMGVEIVKGFRIPVISLSSKSYFEILQKGPDDDEIRDYYDSAAIALIEEICTPDLIVLAGYRRKLGSLFINRYENRIINLYPGDTTKAYLIRGVDASVQALRAGEKEIKCTVFLSREGQRFGPAIIQSQPISLEGLNEENVKEMQEKIREEGEWQIFPFAVHHLIAKGRVGIDSEDNIYIDGVRMTEEGYQFKYNYNKLG